jgi:hypothetical protein
MKNIIETFKEPDNLQYTFKNHKPHALYYYCFYFRQENKLHRKKDNDWQNGKQHYNYSRDGHGEYWFNHKRIK